MMFSLNMVDYSMSFLLLSSWDFFCWTGRGDHSEPFLLFDFYCGTPPSCLKVIGWMVQPAIQWHSQLYSGTAGYPHILTLAVQLDLGHLPDTQGYSGLLSEPCTINPDPLKVIGWMAQPAIWWMAQPAIWWHSRLYGGWHSRLYGGWVAHEILVSAQGPLVFGFGAKGLGPGLDKNHNSFTQKKHPQAVWIALPLSQKLWCKMISWTRNSFLYLRKAGFGFKVFSSNVSIIEMCFPFFPFSHNPFGIIWKKSGICIESFEVYLLHDTGKLSLLMFSCSCCHI